MYFKPVNCFKDEELQFATGEPAKLKGYILGDNLTGKGEINFNHFSNLAVLIILAPL